MNFRKLTDLQQRVFGQIAMNVDKGHPKRTLEFLEKKGLIISETENKTGFDSLGYFSFPVTKYRVPILVHAEWCEWCSQFTEEELIAMDEKDSPAFALAKDGAA